MSVYSSWAALICTLLILALISTKPFRGTDLPPQDGRTRRLALDGVRGFAAFGVFLHHALITHDYYALGYGNSRRPASSASRARSASTPSS